MARFDGAWIGPGGVPIFPDRRSLLASSRSFSNLMLHDDTQ
jgi:hypothetical protein